MTQTHDTLQRYQRALHFEQSLLNGKPLARNTTLYPHWVGESALFWYQRDTSAGHDFRLVNANTLSNEAAFDHPRLAKALAQSAGEAVNAESLPLSELDLAQAPARIDFTALGARWRYHRDSDHCEALEVLPADWQLSPDGKQAAFIREHNLWLKDLHSGEEKALTQDGERLHAYAAAEAVSLYGKQGFLPSVEARWSPDGKRLLTVVRDLRDIGIAPPLVEHVPADGSLRPQTQEADRRAAFVGDEAIEAWQLLSIEVASGAITWANYPATPVMYPPYKGYFSGQRGWWDADSRHAYFIDQARGAKAINLVKLDTLSGDTEVIIQESHERCVTLIPITHMSTLVFPLAASNELIWFSERDGWGHLYLYDMASGDLKNPITQGDWLVRAVLHIDPERRELLIQTAGREAGRNPYYSDICRVHMDTGELTPILASDHDYTLCEQRSRISAAAPSARGVSAAGDYIVATRSRVDQAPQSLLLDAQGQTLMVVESADVSGLPADCHWPEPVMLKGSDGETDIYGVVFRPSNFDPSASYPVVDCSYQYASPVGSFTNNPTGNQYYLLPWAYAELGFIVVMLFNRGNDGLRDVAFNTYQHPDFPLAPAHTSRCYKNDVVAGIQQLAERYPYMDLNRVGVMEFGSVPSALMGLLVHGDFYQVGVSVRAMANSRMEGSTAGILSLEEEGAYLPEFEDRADRLQGKLLLINGMLDWCMPVAMTLRLMEALKNAHKRFDSLLLPNLEHGYCHYVTLRCWDYLVEHLLGLEPPALTALLDDASSNKSAAHKATTDTETPLEETL